MQHNIARGYLGSRGHNPQNASNKSVLFQAFRQLNLMLDCFRREFSKDEKNTNISRQKNRFKFYQTEN